MHDTSQEDGDATVRCESCMFSYTDNTVICHEEVDDERLNLFELPRGRNDCGGDESDLVSFTGSVIGGRVILGGGFNDDVSDIALSTNQSVLDFRRKVC